MVKPVDHDFGSSTATTVLGAVKGGLFYGILGTAAATIGGAAIGAIALGAPVGLVSLATDIDLIATAATGAAWIGAALGGAGGLIYGGAASAVGGTIAGLFEGRTQVAREQNLAESIELQKANVQGQMIAQARGQAAEQYSTMGYMQGVQDGQAQLMNQLQSAAMQQHAKMEQQDSGSRIAKDIIAKHHAKHSDKPVSHVERLTNNHAEPSLGAGKGA